MTQPFLTFKAAKGNFFDRGKVLRAMDRATRQALSKLGAYVRTHARTSLKYRPKPSTPGSPPSAHKSISRQKTNRKGVTKVQAVSPLREFIFFSYDEQKKSVVIGPVLLSGAKNNGTMILPALEYGGVSIVQDRGRRRIVSVRERPFMRPALAAESVKLAGLLRDKIK